MTNLSIFLKSDQEAAKRELDCYEYLMCEAIKHMLKGEFAKAEAYHQNMARSLSELSRMKNNKEQIDLMLKQIEGEQQQKELLERLGVRK